MNQNDNQDDFYEFERNRGRYSTITLLIRHPSIDPDVITKELGLEPYSYSKAGEDRTGPTGLPLEGKWENSSWNYVYRFFETRKFLEKMAEIVDQLYSHRAFFLKLASEGCDISLNLNVPGIVHQGSMLSISAMEKMAEMKIRLGVEVFPDWVLDDEEEDTD